MNRLLSAVFAVLAASAVCAAPQISAIAISQSSSSRLVEIRYTLSGGPAVVTADIQTNAGNNVWSSIGEQNFYNLAGDVNCKVTGDSEHTIKWAPHVSWPDHDVTLAQGGIRAVVTAWALDNPPDYLVVDLASGAVKYYVSTNALPGGLLGGDVYRTSQLVLRRIHAAGVPFSMGDPSNAFPVTLESDFYLGVFPVTQGQVKALGATNASWFNKESVAAMRPVETTFANARGTGTNARPGGATGTSSVCGKLHALTTIDFDLPWESQWEFAARGGQPEGRWGDGTPYGGITNSPAIDDTLPGRYRYNGGFLNDGEDDPASSADIAGMMDDSCGTATVGSFAPNKYGLYDMHGNVEEWCIDWVNWSSSGMRELAGRPNVDPDDGTKALVGNADSGRVLKGGSYKALACKCRATTRDSNDMWYQRPFFGMRVMCPIEVK